MIVEKRTKIIYMTLTMLFVLVSSALAEGEWDTNNGGDIYNTKSGNVGIGTTSPAGGLHVFRGNPTKFFVGHDDSGGQVARAAVIEKQTSSPYHLDFYWSNNPTSNAGDLTFYSSKNSPRVIFKANGYVGIGNTNPDHPLVVGPPGGGRHLVINDIPQARWGFATGNYALNIQNHWEDEWTSRMLISKEGNVGIGTLDPSEKLDVKEGRIKTNLALNRDEDHHQLANGSGTVFGKIGLKYSTADLYLGTDTYPNIVLLDRSTGNVGIGTPDPAEKLDVKEGRIKTNMALSRDEDHHRLANDSGTVFGKIGLKYSTADLYLGTDTYPNLVLLDRSTGNVGIGTTSPTSVLEVRQPNFNEAIATFSSTGGGEHSAGIGVDGRGSNWGAALFQDGVMRFSVESNGGAIIGGGYMDSNAPANGAIIQGNVGVGTTTPQTKLAVNGTITAKEIKVESGWSDFVFDEEYDLASLEEVESYIKQNKRLPDIPSAKEVEQQGVAVSEMLARQMQKIEELTLYLIKLEKENKALKTKNVEIEKRLARLEADG